MLIQLVVALACLISNIESQKVKSKISTLDVVIPNVNLDDRPIASPNHKSKKTREPKDIWNRLKRIKTLDDLFETFDPQETIKYKKVKVQRPDNKLRGSKDEVTQDGYVFENQVSRDAVSSPIEFECEPRPQIIQVPIAEDGAYWPSCVQVMQCGGCCVHKLYQECAPISFKNQSTVVWKIFYDYEIPPIRKEVYMIHHAQCGCRCRIDASECRESQTFNSDTCQCECRKTPEVCPIGKQWSDIECGCVCSRQSTMCPQRQYWNGDRCRCECLAEECPPSYTRDPFTCYCLLPQYGGRDSRKEI